MSARSITVLPGLPVSSIATAPVSVGQGWISRPSSFNRSVMRTLVSCSLKLTSGCLWKWRRSSTTSSMTEFDGVGVAGVLSLTSR